MHFTAALVSLALVAGVIANPVPRAPFPKKDDDDNNDGGKKDGGNTQSEFTPTPIFGCLLPWQATNIVNAFNYLLANPTAPNFAATANALFSDDFTDTSDSINQLAGIPEGSVTFANKAAFISSSGAQPPLYLQGLDTFNSCNAISWRWISISGTGDDNEKVKGIDNFYINGQGQIKNVYAEFNSASWINDLGGNCVAPAP